MEIKLTISLDDKTHETLQALTTALGGKAMVPEPETKAPEIAKKKAIKASIAPLEAAPAEQTETSSMPIEDLRALLASSKREKGTDAIKEVLKSYGANLLSELDPKHYAAVASKVREL